MPFFTWHAFPPLSNELADADSDRVIAAARQHCIKYQAVIVNVLWGQAARLQFEARGTDLERQQQGGPHI